MHSDGLVHRSTRGIHRPLAAALVMAAGLSTPALAASEPTVSWPLTPAADQPLPYARTLDFDAQALDALRMFGTVRVMDFVLPDGSMTSATLSRVDPFAPGAQIVAGSDKGEVAVDLSDMVMLSGTLDSDPSAKVFISFSAAGVNGLVRSESGTMVISSGPFGEGHAPVIYSMDDLPQGAINWRSMPCGLDRLVGRHGATPNVPVLPGDGGGSTRGAGPCRAVDVAVETDWEYTQIFGGNTTASAAYAATLFAADSEIYRSEINTRLQISFLRVWSNASDPYVVPDNYDRLFEFRDYWNANMGHVQRDLAHFLAGVLGSTGGVAWLEVMCNSDYGYGLSSYLDGFFPYPLQNNHPQNWDLVVTSHELGHNFGAPHTHDVGVDGCGNGNCSNASQGTIMSYCHTCSGGIQNIKLILHPTLINGYILPHLASAPCSLGDDGVLITDQPDDATADAGQNAAFSVAAIVTGTTAYQWFKVGSGTPLANDGHYAGVTTATLTINNVTEADEGSYRVTVTSTCSSESSTDAALTVESPCPSDFDGSGFVDIEDYTAFVLAFEAGTDNADFDGSGFVDIEDFTAFVLAFESGC